jgi:hypothetical protein
MTNLVCEATTPRCRGTFRVRLSNGAESVADLDIPL